MAFMNMTARVMQQFDLDFAYKVLKDASKSAQLVVQLRTDSIQNATNTLRRRLECLKTQTSSYHFQTASDFYIDFQQSYNINIYVAYDNPIHFSLIIRSMTTYVLCQGPFDQHTTTSYNLRFTYHLFMEQDPPSHCSQIIVTPETQNQQWRYLEPEWVGWR